MIAAAYASDDTFDYGPTLLPASTPSTLTTPQQYLQTQTRHMTVTKFEERQSAAASIFVDMDLFRPRPYVDPALFLPERIIPIESSLEQGIRISAEFVTPALFACSYGPIIGVIAGAANLIAHAILTLQFDGWVDLNSWSGWIARKVVQMALAALLSGAFILAFAIASRVGDIVIVLLPVMIITAVSSLASSMLNRAATELIKNSQSVVDTISKLFSSTV